MFRYFSAGDIYDLHDQVRGGLLKSTYGKHKELYISLFSPTMFGSIYFDPPYVAAQAVEKCSAVNLRFVSSSSCRRAGKSQKICMYRTGFPGLDLYVSTLVPPTQQYLKGRLGGPDDRTSYLSDKECHRGVTRFRSSSHEELKFCHPKHEA